jgi:uncharacterized membrane protein
MTMQTREQRFSTQERTLKGLSPNVAALLCYVGGWISGIVFLVLEQKNRNTRFHALQSIIVFGTLTLAGTVLGNIPVIGGVFSAMIGITSLVLWIILMVKAINGEMFKLSWAGNLAERLANETGSFSQPPAGPAAATSSAEAPQTPQSAETRTREHAYSREEAREQRDLRRIAREEAFFDRYYSDFRRNGRMIASVFAIAWSSALLIFFNFYHQYIAWYEPVTSGGTTHWQTHTVVNADFNIWLPMVTAMLVASIIGHAVLITYDRFLLRQLVRTVLDVLGAASVITLVAIFPFDFSSLPGTTAADGVTLGLTISLVFIAACFCIGALVNFIKLIVHTIRGEY